MIIELTSRIGICDLSLPPGQPVITRDAPGRITQSVTTYQSVRLTTTAAWNADNTIVPGSFAQTLEDVP